MHDRLKSFFYFDNFLQISLSNLKNTCTLYRYKMSSNVFLNNKHFQLISTNRYEQLTRSQHTKKTFRNFVFFFFFCNPLHRTAGWCNQSKWMDEKKNENRPKAAVYKDRFEDGIMQVLDSN